MASTNPQDDLDDVSGDSARVSKPSKKQSFLTAVATKRNFILLGVVMVIVFFIAARSCTSQAPVSSLGTTPKDAGVGDPRLQADHVARGIRERDGEIAERLVENEEAMARGTSFTPQVTREFDDPLDGMARPNAGFRDAGDRDPEAGKVGAGSLPATVVALDPNASGRRPRGSGQGNAQAVQGDGLLLRTPLEVVEMMRSIDANRDKTLALEPIEMIALGLPTPLPVPEEGEGSDETPEPPIPTAQVYAQAGSMVYAVMDFEANSDGGNFVQATVIGGPYDGAKVIGSFTPVGEVLELNFTRMVFDGTYQISAIGVNPDEPQVGMATSVNKHYVSRFGGLFLAAALKGVGDEVKRSGDTTVVNLNTGTTVSQGRELEGRNIALSAAGEVGIEAGNVLRQGVNRPPTIIIAANTPIGIVFRDDWVVGTAAVPREITPSALALPGAAAR